MCHIAGWSLEPPPCGNFLSKRIQSSYARRARFLLARVAREGECASESFFCCRLKAPSRYLRASSLSPGSGALAK